MRHRSPHIDWVERRFAFNFSVGLYPELIERLRGTPARLADHLGLLPPAVRNPRAGPDWSMQDHPGHLWDLDELAQSVPAARGYVILPGRA